MHMKRIILVKANFEKHEQTHKQVVSRMLVNTVQISTHVDLHAGVLMHVASF